MKFWLILEIFLKGLMGACGLALAISGYCMNNPITVFIGVMAIILCIALPGLNEDETK